ncbi:MAG: zinc ABC transporter substrate-binding protein [Gammaproteobacteria bacterium]|nr:zinc ABC transporter substrate-binding protein [Gammaproteobacteria bacterium]
MLHPLARSLAALCLCVATTLTAAPRVVVSILPLHSLTAGVMQGVGEPLLLFTGGQSPHRLSLTPSQVRRLSQADLMVWIGESLELPLARVIAANLPADRSLELIDAAGISLLPVADSDAGEGADAADAAAHGHAGVDPHIWLSPDNARAIVQALAERLAALDPKNADRYRANAVGVARRLADMEARHRARLAEVRSRPYMVFHDAYRYLERYYGLSNRGAVTLGSERAPGARHLRQLRARIERDNVVCLFSEPQFSPKLVATLTEGGKLRVAVLDPLGAGLSPGADAYFSLMERLVSGLTECLSF